MKAKMAAITTGALSILALVALSGCGSTNANSSTPQQGGPGSWGNSSSHRGGFGGGMMNMSSVASVLKISTSTLTSDLKSGDSLEQIAQKQGVPESTLISSLESSFKSQMDKAVSSGRMSSSQEQQMISRYDSNISKTIQHKGLSTYGRRGSGSGSNWSGNSSQSWNNNNSQ